MVVLFCGVGFCVLFLVFCLFWFCLVCLVGTFDAMGLPIGLYIQVQNRSFLELSNFDAWESTNSAPASKLVNALAKAMKEFDGKNNTGNCIVLIA